MEKRIFFFVPAFILCISFLSSRQGSSPNMVLVKGGTFDMGDVFKEGNENELPVHRVTVDDFYLSKYEVTVGEFREFVNETGYVTSAEHPVNMEKQMKIQKEIQECWKAKEKDISKLRKLYKRIMNFGGTGFWDVDKNQWTWSNDHNWRNPGFEQADNHPVISLSWDDAASYCNWLSKKEGLPPAYNVETGELLDKNGRPAADITKVKGYRLPTEAEWEYAARERGKKVRFGNGKNTASSEDINFDGCRGDYHYLQKYEFRKGTVPVGSFKPNSIGLHDMSGNGWEWCSDYYGPYSEEDVHNPHVSERSGINGRVIRGGRWGGSAFDVRVFAREQYTSNNRCNNSGFRVARSE